MHVLGIALVVACVWVLVVERSPKLEAAIGWPVAIGVVLILIIAAGSLLYLLLVPLVTALQ